VLPHNRDHIVPQITVTSLYPTYSKTKTSQLLVKIKIDINECGTNNDSKQMTQRVLRVD